jgi:hypothetical protein
VTTIGTQVPRRITWLGGHTFLVSENTNRALPYRYMIESEDGRFRTRVKHTDSLVEEIEELLKGETG